MATRDAESDLIRGNIDAIVLRTLAGGDSYGYEILKDVASTSRGGTTCTHKDRICGEDAFGMPKGRPAVAETLIKARARRESWRRPLSRYHS